MKTDVFISYSSKDLRKVNAVKFILEKHDLTCWMAPQSIPAGSNYAREIPAAIKSCCVFLLMITESAQESPWISKEVSVALTNGKIIIPLILENCELTEVFNFYLTDIQCYHMYEEQLDVLQQLIFRITEECRMHDGTADVRKNTDKIVLTDHGKSNTSVVNWISNRSPVELERILAGLLTRIRREYKNNPNAQWIENWFERETIASYPVGSVLEELFYIGLYSYNEAEIDLQLAVIYIHSGDRKYVKRARELLERAIQILEGINSCSEMRFKRIVYARWLMAVTYKQERNYGYACDLCEELIQFIEDENKIFDVPYFDALLLPERELVVINKEKIMCDYLTARISEISASTKELFYTQRRLLEFYILNNEFGKAGELIPQLLESFSRCKNDIDEIYHAGVYQNLFEYYIYIGEKERAQYYYDLAFTQAKKNFWKGKQNKLITLKDICS